jgi:hypothetical protein
MQFAYPTQRLQDWMSQQWVIWRGQNIDPANTAWLMGPFGNSDYIADEFIAKLALDEQLIIERQVKNRGLLTSIKELELSAQDYARLNPAITHFYENTALYDLNLRIEWKALFRFGGGLVSYLYSNRLKQLNFPMNPRELQGGIQSEVVTLRDQQTGNIKYTVWYRTLKSNGRVLYAGIYTTCKLPCGKACIKVIFPLPRGNATVIMVPSVGANGELMLTSAGKKYGDPGFYFLLNDSKGGHWAQYIRSFRERLTVSVNDEGLLQAEHVLTLWQQQVLNMHYKMKCS